MARSTHLISSISVVAAALLAGASSPTLLQGSAQAAAPAAGDTLVLLAQAQHTGGHRGKGKIVGGHDNDDHASVEDAIVHDDAHDSDHGGGHDSDVVVAQKGPQGQGAGRGKGGPGVAGGGHGEDDIVHESEEEEDSDRPEWAGVPGKEGKPGSSNPTPGVDKGSLYGDLYVILRNDDGVPILKQLPDGTWVVQPIDADGNPIPLDDEGEMVDEALAQEVEFGRLNVGRSPARVLDARLEEALTNLNSSEVTVTVDASGRLTYVIDGETKTIDAPLENLALYIDLMEDGRIDGLTATLDSALKTLEVDGMQSSDWLIAATLLAASADKTSSVTLDQVEYMNAIIGLVGTLTTVPDSGTTFIDYSPTSYDRSTVWGNVTAAVLVPDPENPDGWIVDPAASIYELVFASSEDGAANLSGVDAFVQAADDALQVIEFMHEYEVPLPIVAPTSN